MHPKPSLLRFVLRVAGSLPAESACVAGVRGIGQSPNNATYFGIDDRMGCLTLTLSTRLRALTQSCDALV